MDAFDLFGSDSDSDNDAPHTSEMSLALIAAAKAPKVTHTHAPPPPPPPPPPEPEPLPPLWSPPLHVGNILLTTSTDYGGSRSFTAQCDLPPGALLIREEPIITWPEEQVGKALGLEAVQHIINESKAHHFKNLHPVDLRSDVPQLEVEKIRKKYSSSVAKLSQSSSIPPENILRLLMTLICNGFNSGVYGYLSIFNHSESPNCIKLQPNDEVNYSEVRAIRPIKQGEVRGWKCVNWNLT